METDLESAAWQREPRATYRRADLGVAARSSRSARSPSMPATSALGATSCIAGRGRAPHSRATRIVCRRTSPISTGRSRGQQAHRGNRDRAEAVARRHRGRVGADRRPAEPGRRTAARSRRTCKAAPRRRGRSGRASATAGDGGGAEGSRQPQDRAGGDAEEAQPPRSPTSPRNSASHNQLRQRSAPSHSSAQQPREGSSVASARPSS